MKKSTDILIIDDEQVIIDSVIKAARFDNLAVDSAMNAAEGIKLFKNNEYKLILCDVMMPDKSGFEVLDEIHKLDINTPFVITTGYSTIENAVKALQNGSMEFLPKPFTFDELSSCFHRAFRYGEILKKMSLSVERSYNSSIDFIPCPANYYRLGLYSWINLESEGTVAAGITDLYFRVTNPVREITFLNPDDSITQGSVFLTIITDDELTHNLLAPVSGKIISVNPKLNESVSLIEKDPYFEGWIYKVIPAELNYELNNLSQCSSDRI